MELLRSRPFARGGRRDGEGVPRKPLSAEADLVTEMREIRHPYEKGMVSRRGIDY
jgi:ATP:corrinoid adenosyltransferase